MAPFERPHVGWWIAILSGMTLLGVLAFSSGAYAVWARLAGSWLPQAAMRWIFYVACALHVGEASYAVALARRLALPVARWGTQTLLLGFPSLRLLIQRRRAAAG